MRTNNMLYRFWALVKHPALLVVLLFTASIAGAQTFRSLEAANENPAAVKTLALKKFKREDPEDALKHFVNLEVIDLSSSGLEKFPKVLCNLKNLRQIRLGDNDIDTIPACVCQLQNLEFIELWDNNINIIPDCLNEISTLKYIDLIGIRYNFEEQDKLRQRFPHINLKLSDPCNCNFE